MTPGCTFASVALLAVLAGLLLNIAVAVVDHWRIGQARALARSGAPIPLRCVRCEAPLGALVFEKKLHTLRDHLSVAVPWTFCSWVCVERAHLDAASELGSGGAHG